MSNKSRNIIWHIMGPVAAPDRGNRENTLPKLAEGSKKLPFDQHRPTYNNFSFEKVIVGIAFNRSCASEIRLVVITNTCSAVRHNTQEVFCNAHRSIAELQSSCNTCF